MNNSNEAPLLSGMRNLNIGGTHQYSNQPPNSQLGGGYQWSQGYEEEDEEDDQPLSYQGKLPKPVSVRNMPVDSNSAKPSSFNNRVPSDMKVVQALCDSYSQKIYISGYVFKKADLSVDGKPLGDSNWSRWYVELCGPVLTFWEANGEEQQQQNTAPQYMNITEANVELLGHINEPGRENVFSLNTTGTNRHLLDVSDENSLVSWVSAIRLSCYEFAKIQEIFTRTYVARHHFSDILAKPMSKMEGFVQVRFADSTNWQKYWVVVTDKKEKKLFSKKSTQSRGQMMFYETKKSKSPLFTMVNVIQSYIIYPENPQEIDIVDTFKVEGSIFQTAEQQPTVTTALITTPSSKELVPWLIGTFDTFKLYGRPNHLYDDPLNINSLNFGETFSNTPRLFLDLPDVVHQVNVRDETLADNKAKFAGILLSKLQSQGLPPPPMQQRMSQQPMGLIHQIPSGAPFTGSGNGLIHQIPNGAPLASSNSSPRPNSQRMSTYSSHSSNMSRSPLPQQTQQQQQQQRVQTSRKIYASDSEDDDDDDEDEDSDDDSLVKQPQKSTQSLALPTMLPSEDDGFASSILSGIEKKNPSQTLLHDRPVEQQSLEKAATSNVSLPLTTPESKKKGDFGLSDTDEEEENLPPKPVTGRPKPKISRTQVSISGSDDDESDEEDNEDDEDGEGSYSGSDDDDVPIHQQRLQQQQQFLDYNDPRIQQQQWDMYNNGMMMNPQQHQGYYNEYVDGDDGPVIPQLGDHFATQNSLLDTYRPAGASAHDQEDYARATGQPLIQVPNKPPAPRAGLVGMISQIEQEKKQKESSKRFDMERDRMERERERYMVDQRSQMMQQVC